MLHVFAKTDTSSMRADENAVLRRHEKHGKHFVHATEAATIDLTKRDRLCLEELFEHDAVMRVLARRDADGFDRARNRRVSKNIVRARRLFDP